MLSERDAPIIAIATAPGKGAVGVLRISGKSLQNFANALCQQTLEPRRAHLILLKDAHAQVLDQVLALFFPSPHSYTGEDVLELQGHGGPVVMSM
ncbi:MAG: tRNA uridine-5-carboxymethylaminomethyl(34) synthesis GTPase MnmE, partial [Burkholderiales bacterium]|nr:tRNA uridine-5-carboxymethylaminomethyl(34) synthesis GTPase MnmE [Burkholderiales bacterium]